MGKTGFSKGARRLHYFCLVLALGSFVWGYNVGVLASVLVHPGFKETLHGGLDAPQSGLITAIYYLGTWLSYIFLAHPAADRLGRRHAALAGMLVTCVGQALQAAASGPNALGMVVAGRVVSGLGTAAVTTSVPLYQSEIAPPTQRGRLVVMNHIGFVAGLAAGFWYVFPHPLCRDHLMSTDFQGWICHDILGRPARPFCRLALFSCRLSHPGRPLPRCPSFYA